MKNIRFDVRLSRTFAPLVLALLGVTVPALADQAKVAGDVGRGAMHWAENCARCHNMRDPKEFNDDQWRVIVTHMRVRGGITGQDARDILTFLQAGN